MGYGLVKEAGEFRVELSLVNGQAEMVGAEAEGVLELGGRLVERGVAKAHEKAQDAHCGATNADGTELRMEGRAARGTSLWAKAAEAAVEPARGGQSSAGAGVLAPRISEFMKEAMQMGAMTLKTRRRSTSS